MLNFGEGLPEEIQLDSLSLLILDENFLRSLNCVALANKMGNRLSRDHILWRHILLNYFPVLLVDTKESLTHSRLVFKHAYIECRKFLNKHNLAFSDYIKYILKIPCVYSDVQQAILMGMFAAAGHPSKMDTLSDTSRDFALIFSTLIGNKNLFRALLNANPAPSLETKKTALVDAARLGRFQFTAMLLPFAQNPRGKSAISEAFVCACTNGHTQTVILFTQERILKLISFSLGVAFANACNNQHFDVIKLLLTLAAIKSNSSLIATQIRSAINSNHPDVIELLIASFDLSRNTAILRETFDFSINNGHGHLLTKLLPIARTYLPLHRLKQGIEVALTSKQEALSLILFKMTHHDLNPFFIRMIAEEAVRHGMFELFAYVLTHHGNLFDKSNLAQLLKLADSYQQESFAQFLHENFKIQHVVEPAVTTTQKLQVDIIARLEALTLDEEQGPVTHSRSAYCPGYVRQQIDQINKNGKAKTDARMRGCQNTPNLTTQFRHH